jgi:hypothetical protein
MGGRAEGRKGAEGAELVKRLVSPLFDFDKQVVVSLERKGNQSGLMKSSSGESCVLGGISKL